MRGSFLGNCSILEIVSNFSPPPADNYTVATKSDSVSLSHHLSMFDLCLNGVQVEVSRGLEESRPAKGMSVLQRPSTRQRAHSTPSIGKMLLDLRIGSDDERSKIAQSFGDMAIIEGRKIIEAVYPLICAMKCDSSEMVRAEAAWALWKIGDSRAIDGLSWAMSRDPSPTVRERAIRALGLIGARASLPAMLNLLHLGRHLHAKIRAALISALGLIRDDSGFGAVLKAAKDIDPMVRYEAAKSLGSMLIGADGRFVSDAMSALIKLSSHSKERNSKIRFEAVRSLRHVHDARANRAVADVLSSDSDDALRSAAASTLLIWNSELTERSLIAALEDDSWQVRKIAARTLCHATKRNGVHNSGLLCEALERCSRMFPSNTAEAQLTNEAREIIKMKVL